MIESEASSTLFYTKPSPATGYGYFGATTEPTTGDDEVDGYSVNSIWYKLSAPRRLWICVDATKNAAVWREIPLSDWRSVRTIFNHNVDYTTVGTGKETILTESLPAYETLTQHGDALFFRLAGRTAANANGKDLAVTVAGTEIIAASSTANGARWAIDGFFERKNNSTLRYEVHYLETNASTVVSEGSITGLDLINSAISFVVSATTSIAAGDITMSLARGWFMPGKNLAQGGLTFFGEPVNFFNVETAFNA